MNNHALKTWVVLTKEIGNRCERFRIVMIATAVFMLIANGYSWFAFYPSHDNILEMLWNSFPRCVSLGRFLVPIYLSVRGQGALPLVTGLLSVVYLGISTCLVTALLRQKSQVELVLTSALLSANLFMVEINTAQAYCRDLFLFALMLNCFGSYFVWRQRNMKGFLASVGLFFVAFGIYPAFLTTAVCLIVSASCLEMLRGELETRRLWRQLAVSLLSVVAAGVLYLIAAHIVCHVMVLSPSMQTSYSIFTLGALEPKLYLEKSVYNYYWFLFSLGFNSHFAGWTGAVAMSSLAVVSFFFVILLCKRTKKFGALMLILAWIVLFPLVSRLANVLSTNNSFRISFAQFLLGPILVSFVFTALRRLQEENINARRLFLNKMVFLAILSCAVAVFVNVRYTNRAFVIQRVLYERMMFHTGQVMRDLVELERSQQIKDKKILVVGLFDVQGWPAPFKDYREIEGFRSSTGITSHLKFYAAARLLGYSFDWNVSDVEMIKMKKEEEVMGMPCYPDSGYIKEVNGFLVIKLGQETE